MSGINRVPSSFIMDIVFVKKKGLKRALFFGSGLTDLDQPIFGYFNFMLWKLYAQDSIFERS